MLEPAQFFFQFGGCGGSNILRNPTARSSRIMIFLGVARKGGMHSLAGRACTRCMFRFLLFFNPAAGADEADKSSEGCLIEVGASIPRYLNAVWDLQ